MPAGCERVMVDDAIPEEARGGAILAVAGVGVSDRRSQDLRYLRVAMQPGKPIVAAHERVEDGAMVELVRQRQPPSIAGVGVQIREHFVHAAEFGVEHLLELSIAQARQNALGPLRELDFHVERRAVSRVSKRVAESRVRLVQGVPWRPEAVEIEGRRSDVPLRELGEGLATASERAQIAIAILVLNSLELADHVVDPLFEARFARGLPHETDG